MDSVMRNDRLVLFVCLVSIGIVGVFHQEKVRCMGRFARRYEAPSLNLCSLSTN